VVDNHPAAESYKFWVGEKGYKVVPGSQKGAHITVTETNDGVVLNAAGEDANAVKITPPADDGGGEPGELSDAEKLAADQAKADALKLEQDKIMAKDEKRNAQAAAAAKKGGKK
jgi:hypothetical protein